MNTDQQVRIGVFAVAQTGGKFHKAVGDIVHVNISAHGFQLCFEIFGDRQVHFVFIVVLSKAQGARIGAAMTRIDHDSRTAHGRRRVVALEHQIAGRRLVVGLVAQKSVFQLQLQGGPAPGSGREQRIFGKAQIIRYFVGVVEFDRDGTGRIVEGICRFLAHLQLHIGVAAVADHLQTGDLVLFQLTANGGDVLRVDAPSRSQIVIGVGGRALLVDQLIAHNKVQTAFADGIIGRHGQIVQRIIREGLCLRSGDLHQNAVGDGRFFVDRHMRALCRFGNAAPGSGDGHISERFRLRRSGGHGEFSGEFYKVGLFIGVIVIRRILF